MNKGGKTLNTTVLTVLFSAVLLVGGCLTAYASPSYYCHRVNGGKIVINGQMNETPWQRAPWVDFRGLVDGTPPGTPCRGKMLWDDKYLYIGLEISCGNVWATVSKGMVEPKNFAAPYVNGNKRIMSIDPFFKIYLDPDGDGKNYLELHVNALGANNDAWVEAGSTNKYGQNLQTYNIHYQWDCAGIKCATKVDGTINHPQDTDKGWAAEVAIPWSSLAAFSWGECPPEDGSIWRASLGYAHRNEPQGKRDYFCWPVMGVLDCHQLCRYAFLNFIKDDKIHKSAAPVNHSPSGLQWKMVWLWTMPDKSDEYIVSQAKALGFNAMQVRSRSMMEECHRQGIQAAGVVNGSCNSKVTFRQKMLPYEDEFFGWTENPAKNLYQGGGEPIQGNEIVTQSYYMCPDAPETLEYGKRRIDELILQGYDIIAFDGIGYQNMYACFCPASCKKHDQYQKEHPELNPSQALYLCSRDSLVSLYQAFASYAREKKPGIILTCHVWPNFAPDPLYGSRLPLNYCGQTVDWFFEPLWGFDKVESYLDQMAGSEHNPGSLQAPFIAVFTPPYTAFPANVQKSPERIRKDLRLIKNSGAQALQMAELGNILNDPAIAAVVREELADEAHR
jgi:hypothetical protein